MENCQIWLGDLWKEFNPDGPVLRWDSEVYSMTLPISWNGVKGIVFSGWLGHGSHRPYSGQSVFIKFEIERCYTPGYNNPKNWKASLDLPCGEIVEEVGVRMAEAKPVDQLGMGRLLTETYQTKKTSDEALEQLRAEDRERQIQRFKTDFGYRHTPEAVSKHLEECLEKYPDLEEKWRELAEKRSQYLIQEDQAEAAQKAERDRIEAERQAEHDALMEKKAKLFRPFTIFKVLYGARMDSEEDWYTQDVHAIAPEPDEAGWWAVAAHGQVKRMKLLNVLSVEEIRVESDDDVPYGVLTTEWLRSDKFDDITVIYRAIPEVLYRDESVT
jgi:hypothetical protein